MDSTPRSERRAKLLASKAFVCKCERCSGADHCRGFRCDACRGTVLHWLPGDAAPGEGGVWRCCCCGAEPATDWLSKQLRTEQALQARLAELDDDVKRRMGRQLQSEGPRALWDLIEAIEQQLSPTHYLVPRTLALLVTWAASQRAGFATIAHLVPGGGVPAPWGGGERINEAFFSALAGKAGAEGVRVLECISASCCKTGGGRACPRGLGGPVTNLANAADVVWAIDDLRRAGGAHTAAATALASRYLPLLRCTYGPQDADVRRMEQLVFPPGRRVALAGLASRPELNGGLGGVLAFDAASGRFTVELEDGTSIRVKAANMSPVPL